MGALADALGTLQPPKWGVPCPVASVLNSPDLDDEDRAALVALIEAPRGKDRVPTVGIVRLLRDAGFSISDNGLGRHRRRECRCYAGTAK